MKARLAESSSRGQAGVGRVSPAADFCVAAGVRVRTPASTFRGWRCTSAAQAGSTGTGAGSFIRTRNAPITWFRHYTENFRTVELNAPFYSWPKIATVKRLAAERAGRLPLFREGESPHHAREAACVHTRMLVEEFYKFAEILGPTLGCFLFQFPPSYRYTRVAIAEHPAAARSAISERGRVPASELVARIGLSEIRRTRAHVLHGERAADSGRLSRRATSSTRACTAAAAGIGTTTRMKSWRTGRRTSATAARAKRGSISTTIATRSRSRTRTS